MSKEKKERIRKRTIVHISDLHLGSAHFLPEVLEDAMDEIKSLKPEIVIVTGDLTAEGYPFQFEDAKKCLEKISDARMLIVPGNHDSYNVGYLHFEKIFGSRYVTLHNHEITILGMDSSEPDLDDGHIGREHYEEIKSTFRNNRDNFKIFFLHHHLLPVPQTGREKNILVDAGDVLELLITSGVNLVLSGHRHVPHLWKLNNMYLLNAGTVSTNRLRGSPKPSYNIIEIGRNLVIRRKYVGAEDDCILDVPVEA
jgi:3',5'-cyclic AMP phosphodiesterase CpdA